MASKRFIYLHVARWEHPELGPQVDLSEVDGGVEDYVHIDARADQVAEELRRIANWLEGKKNVRRAAKTAR